ncbi:MAG: glycoside hydrolase family 97 catalytic domain-containing protein [Rikenellaceae bacterium]
MKRTFTLLVALVALFATSCVQQQFQTFSPDSALIFQLDTSRDTLYYQIYRDGSAIVDESPLLLAIGGESVAWEMKSRNGKKGTDKFPMITGEHSEVELAYVEQQVKLQGSTSDKIIDATLKIRLYDGVVAYRFDIEEVESLSGKLESYTVEELSELHPSDGAKGNFYAPNGENVPFGALPIEQFKGNYTTPVIYEGEDVTLSIHEVDLHNYPQLRVRTNKDEGYMYITPGEGVYSGDEGITLPWRVILTGDSIVELHNLKKVYLSLATPAEGDFSWVQTGFSTWDWRVKGCTFGGELYEMTTPSLKRYLDFCARNGLEYFLIDAEWFDYDKPLIPVEGLDIKEVIRYGNEIGVGMIMYYDLKYMAHGYEEFDYNEVAKTFADWGAKGVKYGFLGAHGTKLTPQQKAYRSEEIIQISAKHNLIILFHDGPIPFGGLERQYPNYLNREYCHAQMDRRWAFTPTEFTKMACVNFLGGPIDQTNGTFALNTIKDRSKGPRNEYHSTVAAEAARIMITFTGNLAILLDAPEAYEEKADIFEYISSMPETWDESRYLTMEWDTKIAVARRGGDDWFVSTAYGDKGGNDELTLSMLADGVTYNARLYRDSEDSDYINNKESYTVEDLKGLKKGDLVKVKVARGGGYSLHLTPAK